MRYRPSDDCSSGCSGRTLVNPGVFLVKKKKTHLDSRFTPDLTPEQMKALGVLRHKGSQYGEGEDKDNFFGVRASLDAWPEKWHNEQHPQGWFQWYQGYAAGKRTDDDERQIKRWLSFKARHLAQLQKADPTLSDLSIQPKRRQALLNWAIAPGINVETEVKNKYLEKIAEKAKSEGSSWNGIGSLLASQVVGGVASIPVSLGAMALGKRTMNEIKNPLPGVADKYTVKKFLRDNPEIHKNTELNRRKLSDYKHALPGPAYLDSKMTNRISSAMHKVTGGKIPKMHVGKSEVHNVQGIGKSHSITMHELGHAKDFQTGMSGVKRALGTSLFPLKFLGGAATLGALSNKHTEDYAPAIAGISGAINLRQEGMANYHAYHGIKAHKGAKAANKFLTKIVPSQMGNYALAAAAPVVAAYVGKKVIQKIRGDKE